MGDARARGKGDFNCGWLIGDVDSFVPNARARDVVDAMLRREQCAFLAAVLVGAYGVDRGLSALVALAATYYATRCERGRRARARATRRVDRGERGD